MRMPLQLRLAKTPTFAVAHFALSAAHALTGSAPVAGAIAAAEPLADTVADFLHERARTSLSARRAAAATAAR